MAFGHGVNDIPGSTGQTYFTVWYSMIRRCYSDVYQANKPTYIGTVVADEWKLLSNFKVWFDANYVEGWQMDKDVLGDGKLYSPNTCCFLPAEINLAIAGKRRSGVAVGVYYKKKNGKYCAQMAKDAGAYLGLFDTVEEALAVYVKAKEGHIYRLAQKHVDTISPRAYNALMQYQVDLND